MSVHRDRALAHDVGAVVGERPELVLAALTLEVHGGVVHARGRVASAAAVRELRTVLHRVRGVHAVWDLLQVEGRRPLRVLDVGCGATKQVADAIGLDREPYPGVDVVADLERPLPLADGAVDHVFAIHLLEHVHNLLPLLNELHRVLRPDGVLHVIVPHHGFVNAWADPTHVRYFHPQTFKFVCRPYPGMRPFFPCGVSASTDNIYADLEPVDGSRPLASEEELARFFD